MFLLCLVLMGTLHPFALASSTSEDFFPLRIGNWWYYHQVGTVDRYFTVEITDTTRFEDEKYYVLDGVYLAFNRYIRFDSTGQYLMSYIAYPDTGEAFADTTLRFSAPVCEPTTDSCVWEAWFGEGRATGWVADSSDTTRSFQLDGMIWREYDVLRNVGITGGEIELSALILVAAVVNGAVYGDTSLVSVPSPPARVPEATRLLGNYPNPFNSHTTITYHLATAGEISVAIYNVQGHLVKELTDGYHVAGKYTVRWDGTNGAENPVGSGIYLYRFEAASYQKTGQMVLIR